MDLNYVWYEDSWTTVITFIIMASIVYLEKIEILVFSIVFTAVLVFSKELVS